MFWRRSKTCAQTRGIAIDKQLWVSTDELMRQGLKWFRARYEDGASQVIDFLGDAELSMTGFSVADIGSGDGVMALGIAKRAMPKKLVGFDINRTDTEALLRLAKLEGVAEELPPCLEFHSSEPRHIPADDGSFDFVYTWSAFEHVVDPLTLLKEIRRIMRPHGVLMLQLWPFFNSKSGSHLDEWFPEGFSALTKSLASIKQRMESTHDIPQEWADVMLGEFQQLNRLTVDDLQAALLSAGLYIRKLQVLSDPIRIPPELAAEPLSRIGISGVKLLAIPC